MTDTAFGHDGDRHSLLNAPYHLGITHAGNTAGGPDVGRNPLKGHDGAGSGGFGNPCLLRGCYIHYYAALQHLGEIFVQFIAFVRHFTSSFL